MKVVDDSEPSEEKEDSEEVREADDDGGITFVVGEETHDLTEDVKAADVPREDDGRQDEVVTGEEKLGTEDGEQPEKELVVSMQGEEDYPTEKNEQSESPEDEQKEEKSLEETGEDKEEKVESGDDEMMKVPEGDISNVEEGETADTEKESLNENVMDKSQGDDTVAQPGGSDEGEEEGGSIPLVEDLGGLDEEEEEEEVATKPTLDVVEEEGESETASDIEEVAEIKAKEDDSANDADVSKVCTDDVMADVNSDKDPEVKMEVVDDINDREKDPDFKNVTDSEVCEATTVADAELDKEPRVETSPEPNQAPSGGDLSVTSTCQVCLFVLVCLSLLLIRRACVSLHG